MKKSRFLAILLAAALTCGTLFTGCSKSSGTTGSGSTNNGAASDSKVTDITLAFILTNAAAPDMPLVQDEINKISEKKIGVHVNIKAINVGDYETQINLMTSANQPLDLLHVFGEDFATWYANGTIIPIDDQLKKYGQDVLNAVGKDDLKAGQINGKQYGVTTMRDLAKTYGVAFRTDLLEKYGIDGSTIKTPTDVEKALATAKSKSPNSIPLTASSQKQKLFDSFSGAGTDPLGDGLGVLIDMTNPSLKVENLFASGKYENFVKMMRRWYTKGYIQSDVATSSEVGATIMKSGRAFGEFVTGKPGLETQLKAETGYDMQVCNIYKADKTSASVQNIQYAVSKNCKNADKTIQFLNLLYSNKDVANLLNWGIEGKDYVKKSDGHITFPQGITAKNSRYNMQEGWIIGNQFITDIWDGNSMSVWNDTKKFNANATVSKAMGFTFDSSSVKTEYAACTAVTQQYRVGLECGEIDPAIGLKQFNSALEAAGLQKIINAKQSQLTAWAKAQDKG